MACNRETSTDGTTPSPPPVCGQNPDPFVPCCNKNCLSFGCAATMNLCSKCYSERILNQGGGVDAAVYTAVMRPDADGTDEASPGRGVDDDCRQRIQDVTAAGGLTAVDKLDLRDALGESNQFTNGMNRSGTVSDFQAAIVRSVAENSTAGVVCCSTSDLPQQPIPSPLSLSSESPRALSPVRPRQFESKVSLLPSRQQAVNRCMRCRKRVGLVGFKCRCGDIFCAVHRYSDRHDCSFDYKAAGRAAVAKENPVVKATKMVKI